MPSATGNPVFEEISHRMTEPGAEWGALLKERTLRAIKLLKSDVRTEEFALSAASTQTTKGVYEGICAQSERREMEGVAGRTASVIPSFSRSFRARARETKKLSKGARPGPPPRLATKDWKKAHFQVGIDVPEENPVEVRGSAKGGWRVFPARALNMGSPHSVPSWCGIAELDMSVMEALLWAPRLTYIDDSALVSRAGDIEDCAKCFGELSKALCLVGPPKCEPNTITLVDKAPKTLGIVSERRDRHFCLGAPDEKLGSVRKKRGEVVKAALRKSASYKQAAKVVGDTCYILCSGADRVGIQIPRPVFPMLVRENFEAMIKRRMRRRVLVSTMGKVQLLLENYEPTFIGRGSAARPRVWLYADASSNGSAQSGPRAGAAVVTQEGALLFALTDELPLGKSIDFCEAAAAQLATRSFPDALKGRRVVVSVDNTVDCSAFVKASRRDLETTLLITMVIPDTKALDIAPFFTYVLSELSIAGWTTRDDLLRLFGDVGGASFRPAVAVGEWVEPGNFLTWLRAGGVGLSEQTGHEAPPLRLQKLGAPSAGARAIARSGCPLDWALTLPELNDEGRATEIEKLGERRKSELSE